MGDLSVFRHFRRRVRLSVALLALAVAALFVIEALFEPWDRTSMAPVALVFGVWVAAVIVLDFRFWRSVESAERLLDVGCSSEALVARGDGMHLLGDMPRDGLTRGEVVLLHRYALALADVGRSADAALARRRMEEALTRMRHPERNLDGATACMLLADVSARLGDVTAARIYAGAFRRGCSYAPQGHGAHERDIADVGAVVLGPSSSSTCRAPAQTRPLLISRTGTFPRWKRGGSSAAGSRPRRGSPLRAGRVGDVTTTRRRACSAPPRPQAMGCALAGSRRSCSADCCAVARARWPAPASSPALPPSTRTRQCPEADRGTAALRLPSVWARFPTPVGATCSMWVSLSRAWPQSRRRAR